MLRIPIRKGGKKLYSVQTLYKPSRELEEDRGVSLSFAFSLSPPLSVCLYPGPSLLPSPVSLLMFLTDFSWSPRAQRSRGAEDRGQEARARERGGGGGSEMTNQFRSAANIRPIRAQPRREERYVAGRKAGKEGRAARGWGAGGGALERRWWFLPGGCRKGKEGDMKWVFCLSGGKHGTGPDSQIFGRRAPPAVWKRAETGRKKKKSPPAGKVDGNNSSTLQTASLDTN